MPSKCPHTTRLGYSSLMQDTDPDTGKLTATLIINVANVNIKFGLKDRQKDKRLASL